MTVLASFSAVDRASARGVFPRNRYSGHPPFAREPTSSAMASAVVSNTIAASAAARLVTIFAPVAVAGSIDPLDPTLRHVRDPDRPTG